MTEMTNQTLETLACLPTRPEVPTQPQLPPDAVRQKPCSTPWQRKWLDLECNSPVLQEAATEVERWATRVYDAVTTLSLVAIYGETGTGKTRMINGAAAWARFMAVVMWERGGWGRRKRPKAPEVVSLAWPVVTDSIRAKRTELVDDCQRADVLFLDDIGAEDDPFQQATDKLCQILSRRENKHTMLTTNVMPEHWEKRFDARVDDRLLRNSVVINMSGVQRFSVR